MRKVVFFISILLSLSTALSGAANPRVSILICGKGNDLYSIFGHAAVRVKCDTSDDVFNFGTFDFETPGFASKFIRGDLNYFLSKENFRSFLNEYVSESRNVTEYPVLLNSTDALRLKNSLEAAYSNDTSRAYKYQFLKDNCSTRIYTLLNGNTQSFTWPKKGYKTTFRETINANLNNSPVWRFGINILLGALGETKLNAATNSFLPDSLVTELSKVSARSGRESLLSPPNILFNRLANRSNNYLSEMLVVMAIICMMVWTNFKSQAIINLIFGSLLIFLMIFSFRDEFRFNYNILIFNPLDIFLVYKFGSRKGIILSSLLLNLLYLLFCLFLKIDYPPLIMLDVFILLYKLKKYMTSTFLLSYKKRKKNNQRIPAA